MSDAPDTTLGAVTMGFLSAQIASWATKRGLDKLFARACALFKRPDARAVLIIGPGGVGKSTLAHLFSGNDDSKAISGKYVESVSTEEFALTDDPSVQIVVPPGQIHRRDATWDVLLAAVAAGKFRGVVFMNSYGHHALGDISYKNHRLFDPEKGLDAFVDEYIEECLKAEKRILSIVCDAVRKCSMPIWVLTLVSKQDLWWDQRDKVAQHYATGEFKNILQKSLGSKDESTFRHETVQACLVMRNLMTGQDELLRKTVAGYDVALQEDSYEKLLRIFDGLMSWEEQHAK